MTELYHQDQLFTDREFFESQSKEQLYGLILADGEKVSEIERRMNLAGEVFEGTHGESVSDYHDRKQKEKDGETEATSP